MTQLAASFRLRRDRNVSHVAAPVTPHTSTLADQLAAYFRTRPNEWINAHTLLGVAGFSGWRARISDCRARGMTIQNRRTTMRDPKTGARWVKTEYRFVPRAVRRAA